ncbi:MAG: amino acid ABC transporter ATP-binding protein [Clostridia bacterium]|nr:amino acid ABC transporter ATP-binding protein [Clostridia bacterium]
MIELINLEKKYDNVTPLKDVSTVINNGDVISVIGPSGTGKSTLLRCINMLEKPTSGHILIDGVDITDPKCDLSKARRKMGMVFQSFNLFGHLTVIENLMLAPMDILKKSKQEAYETGVELLRRVGLAGRELQYPEQLSGGQKQRVAIARTLAMDPDLILLDEPTSALDPTMVGEVQAVIRDLSRSGKTMMIVTHEMSFARAICNRVFYMDEGGIYEDGTPEQIFDAPRKELTRRFIRKLKVLEFVIDSRDFDFIGAGTEIDLYCLQNDIAPKEKYNIRLVIEELIQQILLPKLKTVDMTVTVEYSPSDQSATVSSDYCGEMFDPRESENELSLALLRNAADKIDYSFNADAERQNHIEIKIKRFKG